MRSLKGLPIVAVRRGMLTVLSVMLAATLASSVFAQQDHGAVASNKSAPAVSFRSSINLVSIRSLSTFRSSTSPHWSAFSRYRLLFSDTYVPSPAWVSRIPITASDRNASRTDVRPTQNC